MLGNEIMKLLLRIVNILILIVERNRFFFEFCIVLVIIYFKGQHFWQMNKNCSFWAFQGNLLFNANIWCEFTKAINSMCLQCQLYSWNALKMLVTICFIEFSFVNLCNMPLPNNDYTYVFWLHTYHIRIIFNQKFLSSYFTYL